MSNHSYHRGPAKPYPEVVEDVRKAALALHGRGLKADMVTLRAEGVQAATRVLYWALADLVRDGRLPPECRHPKKKYKDPLPTPLEAKLRAEHAPPCLAAADPPSVWKYARKLYWTRRRRAWYRRDP